MSVSFLLMERYEISKKDVGFYYSIAQTVFALVQMFGGLLLGRYTDRTRNIKKVIMLALGMSSICNLAYTLPLPMWIVICARALMGITECLQTAVVGKLY